MQGFIRVDVAALHQKLLKLKHVVDDVLILLKELILVLGVTQLEVLLSKGLDRSVLISRKFTEFLGRVNHVFQGVEERGNFSVIVLDLLLGWLLLEEHQCLKVFVELLVRLEALEHVVARIETLHTTVYHAFKGGWRCNFDPLVAI